MQILLTHDFQELNLELIQMVVLCFRKTELKKILGYINSGTTEDAVNFPTIRLPQQKDRHRFLHIHRNVPGVMAEINKVLASYQLNLVGQYLSTDPEVGYVISDVNNAYNPEVVSALKAIPNTIKFRVLY